MAEETSRLALPYIQASQAQKHVTHNEGLRLLDGIVQSAVINRTRTSPPSSPSAGDCYIVATGGSGAWASWDGDVAMYADGLWFRLPAAPGWRVWDIDQQELLVRVGSAWVPIDQAIGVITRATTVDVAESPNGGTTGLGCVEETLSGLSGASVSSSVVIPTRAICIGVSTRTVAAVTGATSYDCGISGEASKFGGTLGAGQGSTNVGVIGPQAFYADTPIVLSANGGDFTGGAVRLAIHYLTATVPD